MSYDPFAIFSLDLSFDLDIDVLRNKYIELQKEYHPDKYSHLGDDAINKAIRKTSQINDAFNVLKNPISRAEAIVEQEIGEQNIERINKQDISFLTSQLEIRQELENVKENADFDAFCKIQEKSNSLWDKHIDLLKESINNKNWTNTLDNIDKLKFINKIILELEILEEQTFM